MILTEKQQKYHYYHLEKLINMNMSQLKKYCTLIKDKIIEQAKFSYSPLVKAFKKLFQVKTNNQRFELIKMIIKKIIKKYLRNQLKKDLIKYKN